jgi:hypothetical protein
VADDVSNEPPADNFLRDTLKVTIEPRSDGGDKGAVRAAASD